MKDEIKEILENIRRIIKSNRENEFNRVIYDCDSLEKVLDYITNLQEENERLNNQYDLMENSLDEKQEVIDKTLEYIKGWQSFPHTNGSTHNELRNLLNILQGEGKE